MSVRDHDFHIPRFQERFRRHIARGTIGVGRHNAHLLPGPDLLNDRIDGLDFDLGHTRRFEIELGSLGDPLPQDAVLDAVLLHDLPADMRHSSGRLEQHEAVVGRGQVHAPRPVVVGQGPQVVDRVVPAQRELEPVLPVL